MKKTLILCLLSLPFVFSLIATESPKSFTEEEEEWWITDRDNGSRERPNLYDYNRQNVQYNKRYGLDRDNQSKNSYYYNQSSRENTFNRSYYDDNTSPNLYLNR